MIRKWRDGLAAAWQAARGAPGAERFRLIHYFTVASLVAFTVVGAIIVMLQRGEEAFFAEVQTGQGGYFAAAQARLSSQQEQNARESLIATHEAAHVTLARVLSNVLWRSEFGPFVARAAQIPVEDCRRLQADGSSPDAVRACVASRRAKIEALPGFRALDARAYAAMHASNVFKIKVFDLRGITVYSSEHEQIGEDKALNRGWQVAVSGTPASELTHRDRFSAFEGVVENRDLISSYLPVRDDASGEVVGVFEIYSDVTAFLARIHNVIDGLGAIADENQRTVNRMGADAAASVRASSDRFLLIVGAALAALYGMLLFIVRNGQRIIDAQAHDREQAAEREERWHREKMASLATMAANVSHEVGNPLASITAAAQAMQLQKITRHCSECRPEEILAQARRMAAMTRQICDFAGARHTSPELVDINHMLKAMLDFLSFDRRFAGIRINFRPGEDLPALSVIPDHLNEVLMYLLQSCAECPSHPEGLSGCVDVETREGADGIVIRIGVSCADSTTACRVHRPFGESRFDIVRRRVALMGGALQVAPRAVELTLPREPQEAATATAAG